MKHLLTLAALFVSTASVAQIPNYLPYNPDSNSDYFISIPDMLELLALYGSEWENGELIISSDSTAALVYVGNLYMHECVQACSQLEGFWNVANRLELSQNVSAVAEFYGTEVILGSPSEASQTDPVWYARSSTDYPEQLEPTTAQGWYHSEGPEAGLQQLPFFGSQVWIDGVYQNNPSYQALGCWCSTEVAPRIEYKFINAGSSPADLSDAVNQLASEGWFLLGTEIEGKACLWRFAH